MLNNILVIANCSMKFIITLYVMLTYNTPLTSILNDKTTAHREMTFQATERVPNPNCKLVQSKYIQINDKNVVSLSKATGLQD